MEKKRIKFDIDNPRHVEDIKNLSISRENFFKKYTITPAQYKLYCTKLWVTRMKRREIFDENNLEHLEFVLCNRSMDSQVRFSQKETPFFTKIKEKYNFLFKKIQEEHPEKINIKRKKRKIRTEEEKQLTEMKKRENKKEREERLAREKKALWEVELNTFRWNNPESTTVDRKPAFPEIFWKTFYNTWKYD